MDPVTLKITTLGLCAIVLDKPADLAPTKATVVCIDAGADGNIEHRPVLTVDSRVVSPGAVEPKEPSLAPFYVPDATGPGHLLLVWPLTETHVRLTKGPKDGQKPLQLVNLDWLPLLERAAGTASTSRVSKSNLATEHPYVGAVLELPPGGRLAADPMLTNEEWCFIPPAEAQYKQRFSMAAHYTVELEPDLPVELELTHDGKISTLELDPSLAQADTAGKKEIVVAISNEPLATPYAQTQAHFGAFYKLLDPTERPQHPRVPVKCSTGNGGGVDNGIGCSPLIAVQAVEATP